MISDSRRPEISDRRRPASGEVADLDAYRPYTLVAELTYRCALRCAYCSNPLDYARHSDELDTATWLRVFAEAEALGVVQLHFTGGEPLLRGDLEQLVAAARARDLYTTLITSGVPLTRARVSSLRAAGLDGVQLSVQDDRPEDSDRMAGARTYARKREVARWVKESGLPLTLNVVLHRHNVDRVPLIVALAEQLAADRLELANAQYLGWALANRSILLPTRDQLAAARTAASAARQRLRGVMEVAFVMPDYFADLPKPCMDGWGRRFVVVTPDGLALPCHAAHTIPHLEFENVRQRPLGDIWNSAPGFAVFRGERWMPEPCRSCARRTLDFGGCRCQAYHLTGDAAATDPACALAPDHWRIVAARDQSARLSSQRPLTYRAPL